MHKALRVLRENCAYPLTNSKRRSEPASMHRIKIIVPRVNYKQSEVRTINFSDPAYKARHDRMVTLVTQMLELNKSCRKPHSITTRICCPGR
jgi:hypothetical protein